MRVRIAVAIGLVALSAPTLAKKPKPQPCPSGRYVVSGERLITDPLSTNFEALDVDVERGVVTIPGCGERRAVLTPKAKSTIVRAKWASCGDLRRVSFSGTITAPVCNRLQGKLKARKTPPQTFAGLRSTCGDGVIDPVREECDGGGCPDGRDCKDDCTCAVPVIVNTTTTTSTVTTSSVGTTTSSSTSTTSTSTSSTSSTSTTVPATSTSTSITTTVTTSSSTSSSTTTTTTTVGPICGNMVVEPGEDCDPPGMPTCAGTSPAGAFVACGEGCTCPSTSTTVGTPTTSSSTTTTTTVGPVCGNMVVEPGEDCDPPGMPTCAGTSPAGAFVACGEDCTCPSSSSSMTSTTLEAPTTSSSISSTSTTVTSTTLAPQCGDFIVDPGEDCDPPGFGDCSGDVPASCGAQCTCEPIVCADPSRAIFAGRPGDEACRQFQNDPESCEHAWHLAGSGTAASCFASDDCAGCDPDSEQEGLCTNTCGPSVPKTTCDDAARTLFAGDPGSGACQQFDGEQVSCESAWHIGAEGAATCFFDADSEACRGCGFNNEHAGLCTNTCGAATPKCDDPTRALFAGGPGTSACHQFSGNADACEHAWYETQTHGGASCFIVQRCQGCGPNNEEEGLCTNTCAVP